METERKIVTDLSDSARGLRNGCSECAKHMRNADQLEVVEVYDEPINFQPNVSSSLDNSEMVLYSAIGTIIGLTVYSGICYISSWIMGGGKKNE